MSDGNSTLLKLSQACQKHRQDHHLSNNYPNNDEPISDACNSGLKALQSLLPKVENACLEAGTLRFTDVSHLCDFYNDVLEGGFCPHAPNLFGWESTMDCKWKPKKNKATNMYLRA